MIGRHTTQEGWPGLAISKRLRYEILRRDGYRCRYCGVTAEEAVIRVDAVLPEALGGSHKDPANLRAACEPCNSGKTSSSPDAPLVADVAEDALRWAQAIAVAQAQMLAELEGRTRVHADFAARWNNWGRGEGRQRYVLPLPPEWQEAVNSILGAGLPLAVLLDCIDIAMSRRRIADDQKFRYMCGVAWKKVGKLQDAAKALVSGSIEDTTQGGADDEDELPPGVQRGRASLASELLGDLDMEDIDRLLAVARERWAAETDDELHIAAIQIAWDEIRAAAYLATLPEAERADWARYATAAFGELGDYDAIVRPAKCAQIVTHGGWHRGMCHGPGERIAACPAKAVSYVRFAEFDCCRNPAEIHRKHAFCEQHLAWALNGKLHCGDAVVTAIGHEPISAGEVVPVNATD